MSDANDGSAGSRLSLGEGLALAALLAAAAWLRLGGLAAWHLSWDDMWHLADAQQASLGAVLDRNLHHQIHGPLAYVLRYGLLSLTHDPLALRLTSLVPGLLLVPVLWALGRVLLGRAAGLFLAAVAALADTLVVLSQVLRAYALLLLLLSLALWLLALAVRSGDRRTWAGYAVCAALAALTHVSALVPLAVIAVVGIVRLRRAPRRRQAAWLALHAAVAAPAAVWSAAQLYFSGGRRSSPAANLGGFLDHFHFLKPFFPASPWDALGRWADTYRVFVFGPDAGPVPGLVLLALAVAGAALLWRERRGPLLAVCAGVPALGALVGLAGIYPFAASRHCVYAIPFLLLPAAAAVQWLADRSDGRVLAALGAVAALLVVSPDPEHYRRPRADFDTRRADLERTLDALARRVGPHDVVLANRVGMQILNLREHLYGERLEHVDHAPDHLRYPYDVWVVPGGEEHVFRGVRFWACDGFHEWSSFLGAPRLLRRCVEPLLERHPDGSIENLWVWIPTSEAFLVLAAPRPALAARRRGPQVAAFLLALRNVPFWQVFFRDAVDRVYTRTAGAVAVPLEQLEREWRRLGPAAPAAQDPSASRGPDAAHHARHAAAS